MTEQNNTPAEGTEGNYNLRILNTSVTGALTPLPPLANQVTGASNTAMNQAQLAFATQAAAEPVVMFNQEQQPQEPTSDSNHKAKVAGGIALLLCAPLLYIAFTGENDPMNNLMATVDKISAFIFGAEQEASVSIKKQEKTIAPTVVKTDSDDLSGEFTDEMVANPYWYLPIKTPAPEKDKLTIGMMTAVEEDRWVEGLNSQYVYQGFKAATEMLARTPPNAEMMLRKALEHRKFWPRMTALQTLAAMGRKVSDEEADKVFANTRSDLILHYLERFKGDHRASTHFIMQHALKFVDGQNRVAILKMFAEDGEHKNRLYFAAATFDPGPEVQTWAQEYLAYHPVTPEVLREFKDQTVRGYKGIQPEEPEQIAITDAAQKPTQENDEADLEPSLTEDITVKRVEVYKDLPTVDLTNTITNQQDATNGKKTAKGGPKALDQADDGFESLGGKELKYKKVNGVLLDENGKPLNSLNHRRRN